MNQTAKLAYDLFQGNTDEDTYLNCKVILEKTKSGEIKELNGEKYVLWTKKNENEKNQT